MAGFVPGLPEAIQQGDRVVSKLARGFALIGVLIACSQGTANAPENPASGKFVYTGDHDKDWQQIVALEDQAKALVKTDGCTAGDQCRTAPVGNRACGGPRYYLVYCSRTTDSAALFARLKAVADAENEFNTKYQIASTCEFRMPPQVSLVGGSCQAQ
jgi:hypothetical protein